MFLLLLFLCNIWVNTTQSASMPVLQYKCIFIFTRILLNNFLRGNDAFLTSLMYPFPRLSPIHFIFNLNLGFCPPCPNKLSLDLALWTTWALNILQKPNLFTIFPLTQQKIHPNDNQQHTKFSVSQTIFSQHKNHLTERKNYNFISPCSTAN